MAAHWAILAILAAFYVGLIVGGAMGAFSQCNNDCDQGRTCPARKSNPTDHNRRN